MENILRGNAWVCGDDIDTDQIYHGKYLPLTDPKEMAEHAMEFVPGFEGFPEKVSEGDIIIAGRNFGCGSSREHAVICLMENGVSCVIASSFARIFYRNAINLGFPVMICPCVEKGFSTGDEIEVNMDDGSIVNKTTGEEFKGQPISGLERDIADAGGLLEYVAKEFS